MILRKYNSFSYPKRKGLILEIGNFGMLVGFWFFTIDIIGGFHFEIGS